jgi:hypothetical protein
VQEEQMDMEMGCVLLNSTVIKMDPKDINFTNVLMAVLMGLVLEQPLLL